MKYIIEVKFKSGETYINESENISFIKDYISSMLNQAERNGDEYSLNIRTKEEKESWLI